MIQEGHSCESLIKSSHLDQLCALCDFIGSAEGHEYPNLQVGDEVNPRLFLR